MIVREEVKNKELVSNFCALSCVSDMKKFDYNELCYFIKKMESIYQNENLLNDVLLDEENNIIIGFKNNEVRKILTKDKTSLEILMCVLNIFMVQKTVNLVCSMVNEEFCNQIWVAVHRNLGEEGSRFRDVFLKQINSRLVGWKFTIQYAAENSHNEKIWNAYRYLMMSEDELNNSEGEYGLEQIQNYIIEEMVSYHILYPVDKISEVARQNNMNPNELIMCSFCYEVFSKNAYKDKRLPCWIIADYTWGNVPTEETYSNFCCINCERKIASFNKIEKKSNMNAISYDSRKTREFLEKNH